MKSLSNAPKNNQGAALIIALILLAAITVVGISNIQSSTLEMKMITSAAARSSSFAIAEGALKIIEDLLENSMSLGTDDLTSDGCTAGKCFSVDCTDGLCFEGEYTVADDKIDCEISPDADTTPRTEFWSDTTLGVWGNSGKHLTTTSNGDTVKYIIELLCFVGRDDGSSFDASSPNNGDPLFRVTVYNDDNLSPVALQATFAFPL